jgi:hypothetical protein
MLSSNILISNNNYNFYLIEKYNIIIYKKNLFALLDYVIIIFSILDILVIRNCLFCFKIRIMWNNVKLISYSNLNFDIEFILIYLSLNEYCNLFYILFNYYIIKVFWYFRFYEL